MTKPLPLRQADKCDIAELCLFQKQCHANIKLRRILLYKNNWLSDIECGIISDLDQTMKFSLWQKCSLIVQCKHGSEFSQTTVQERESFVFLLDISTVIQSSFSNQRPTVVKTLDFSVYVCWGLQQKKQKSNRVYWIWCPKTQENHRNHIFGQVNVGLLLFLW